MAEVGSIFKSGTLCNLEDFKILFLQQMLRIFYFLLVIVSMIVFPVFCLKTAEIAWTDMNSRSNVL